MALDLAAIKARAVAATEGPWKVIKGLGLGKVPMRDGVKSEALVEGSEWFPAMWLGDSSLNLNTADAEFIAHARQDIPALLAEIERLRLLVPSSQPETPTDRFAPSSSTDPIEHFWTAVRRGWDIEPREHFEREAVAVGFKSPVEMAVHHMWKRRVIESAFPVVQDEAPKA